MVNLKKIEKSSISTPIWDGLSCILYTCNYHDNVKLTLKAMVDTLEKLIGVQINEYEIILVDDGSSDKEYSEILHSLKSNHRVRAFHYKEKQGLGTAFILGLGAAQYSLLFLSTADNRFDYSQIKEFIPKMSEYDAVIGYRHERQDTFLRKSASVAWNFLVNLLFGLRLSDINCPFKMFRREKINQLQLTQLRSRKMLINTEILTLFNQNKFKVLEIPISHYYDGRPEVNLEISVGKVFLAIFRLIILRFRLIGDEILGYVGFITGAFSRSKRPMEVFLHRRSQPLATDSNTEICPICGTGIEALFSIRLLPELITSNKSSRKLIYCKNCQNVFTDPPPTEKQLLLKADASIDQMNWFHKFLLKWFTVRRTGRILHFLSLVESPRILDVGGGNCLFGNSLARSQCQVVIVEPNEESEQFADKQAGVRFIPAKFSSKLLEDGTLTEQSFDCITFWQSIQNLNDINDAFDTITRLLKPDGLLYISTPNISSLQSEISNGLWTYLDTSYQVHLFTPTGLLKLLRKNNFLPLRIYYFSLEYDVFGFFQTILNLLSRSHNYYYLKKVRSKKTDAIEIRYSLWAKIITAFGFIWLPLAILFSIGASVMGKQTCIEVFSTLNDKRN